MIQQISQRIALLVAVGSIILSAGCSVIADSVHVTTFRIKQDISGSHEFRQERKTAQRVWSDLVESGSAPSTCKDFAEAFCEGYAEHLYRGKLTPPPLPPARYRTPRYQNEAGYRLSLEWIEGYKYGIAQAQASGRRRFITGPAGTTTQPADAGVEVSQSAIIHEAPVVVSEPIRQSSPANPIVDSIPSHVVQAVPQNREPPLNQYSPDTQTPANRPVSMEVQKEPPVLGSILDERLAKDRVSTEVKKLPPLFAPPKRDAGNEASQVVLKSNLVPAYVAPSMMPKPAGTSSTTKPAWAPINWAPTQWGRVPENSADQWRPR